MAKRLDSLEENIIGRLNDDINKLKADNERLSSEKDMAEANVKSLDIRLEKLQQSVVSAVRATFNTQN